MTTSAPAVTIEDAGPCRKKVSIEIPGDRVGEKISAAFSELEGSVSLPGFRPGKVPRKLIEKRFGAQLREETKRQLVGEAYQAAVKDNELRIVGATTALKEEISVAVAEVFPDGEVVRVIFTTFVMQ